MNNTDRLVKGLEGLVGFAVEKDTHVKTTVIKCEQGPAPSQLLSDDEIEGAYDKLCLIHGRLKEKAFKLNCELQTLKKEMADRKRHAARHENAHAKEMMKQCVKINSQKRSIQNKVSQIIELHGKYKADENGAFALAEERKNLIDALTAENGKLKRKAKRDKR